MTKISGIYEIRCTISGKIYIGSSIDCKTRLQDHFRALRKGKHGNRHLQSAWDKYGAGAFEKKVIQACPEEFLKRVEQDWILKTKASEAEFGFNCAFPVAQRTPSVRMQEAHKSYWQNLSPAQRAERVKHMSSPEFQAKATEGKKRNSKVISSKVKEAWTRPEADARRDEYRKSFALMNMDPEVIEKRRVRAKERWLDPEYRARGLAQLALANKKAALLKKRKSEQKITCIDNQEQIV